MNSIRRKLTIQLLSGFALLWIGAGTAIYLSVRSGLMKTLDAELTAASRIIRFVGRDVDETDKGGRGRGRGAAPGLSARHPAFYETNGGSFYQIWTEAGETVRRSPSLGEIDLPFPADEESQFGLTHLPDGRRVRTMRYQSAPGGKARGKKGRMMSSESREATVILIAKDMRPTEDTLLKLLGGIVIIGVVGGIGTALLVGGSLSRGLGPLDALGEQSKEMDISIANAGFDARGAPSELQPVYARLNDLIARIQQSFERERRFSSDLAHEMRTPVAELKMMNEIALKYEDQAGEKTHRESLEIANNLEGMLTNLLALARWEDGGGELKNETVQLEPMIRDCWKPHAQTAEQRGVDIQFRIGERPEVESDPNLLPHIIGNLLANASEYCPEQGQVSVFADGTRIEISNPAPNLSADDVPHLCERYWRGDSARTDSQHAGLGLSLAKTCADALGFELSATVDNALLIFVLRFTTHT